ncbi:efflux RND transporter periplasmic adaptor subunit [Malonomonas rubra]|uniref:efflux RND transporter periplasmic adaptor subunit n=1 Tax=Malonomonas rubra TaxID=57040 RepID=UPI0026EA4972|nr:efflux RND transporter periplasmic adaptor subunit [Malonomonas rubra]
MNTNTQENPDAATSLEELIGSQTGRRSKKSWWWLLGLPALVVVAVLFFLITEEEKTVPVYSTRDIKTGKLVVTVTATGNLQPTNQVEVGSELSGIVEEIFVDVNDHVKSGQVLAQLDRSKLNDAVTMSRANLVAAQAQVLQAEATAEEARAALGRYQRVAELSGGKVPSKNEMDVAEATLKRAEANVSSANAGVLQAEANLQSDETNLEKARIRSPIDGVVLERDIDPGQTVAASFQAPVLFLLAEDLSKMELHVDIDEADVGQVKEGQTATFSVDAWPGRQYEAVITRVEYGSQETDGVVSYRTVLAVKNDDLSLRPGMTGTADITTLIHENAVLVPNAALRFTPPVASGEESKQSGSVVMKLFPRPRMQSHKKQIASNGASPRVWVLQEERPMAIDVTVGSTDGQSTEILDGSLKPGMQVITEAL